MLQRSIIDKINDYIRFNFKIGMCIYNGFITI